MKNKAFIFILFILILTSCSLFEKSIIRKNEILASGDFYADSLTFTEATTYSIYLSSDYSLDIFFFEDRDGFGLFADSGLLYSEYIYQPLSYENKTYIDEVFQIFEANKKIYFVIDNRDYISSSDGNAMYTIEIKKL